MDGPEPGGPEEQDAITHIRHRFENVSRTVVSSDCAFNPSSPCGLTGADVCNSIARQVLRKTLAALIYNFDLSLWDEEKDRTEGYRYLNTYPRKGAEGFLNLRLSPRFKSEISPS